MTEPPPVPMPLAALATAEPSHLRELLLGICSSPAWAAAVAASRPWPDRAALLAANARATAGLSPSELNEALAGHARIGTPRPGDAASAREQSGIRGAEPSVLVALAAANSAYEAKFGHVFLICATGRTAAAVLAAVRERLPHDAATEAEAVRAELRKINDLRLDRLLATS
ncbi:2-oxo-4-hydroxy-4-carboxy-5-ureidoimidazoline decarboxylase [Kitasatospora sp. CB01950]|uniref:2-oxo-4-hydroxy-4-carboxy-5-ureidoimidazoline decarboxylase n=1 Tax=Kitasatospora sp. CB01950 TaxID=1703930 RepID=UPI000AAEF7C8|nr:2-oxo-4-hydroxy-4-carboxy-5-ureidoimidazoline decarboxylase [Kitasatospora sp. CB01950]